MDRGTFFKTFVLLMLALLISTASAQTAGGYAAAQDEAFYKRQRELLGEVVARSDVVITTAAVPGRKSPLLIDADAVAKMAPGSVIVDLAAEHGGNCERTRPGQTIQYNGVTIIGAVNLPSTVPLHASQMFARNVAAFLTHVVQDGRLDLDRDDEILRATLLTRDGAVVKAALIGAD